MGIAAAPPRSRSHEQGREASCWPCRRSPPWRRACLFWRAAGCRPSQWRSLHRRPRRHRRARRNARPNPPSPTPSSRLPDQPAASGGRGTALTELLGRKAVLSFLPDRRFPAPAGRHGRQPRARPRPSALWPVNPMPGRFTVEERDGATVIAPDNSSRYTPVRAVGRDRRHPAGQSTFTCGCIRCCSQLPGTGLPQELFQRPPDRRSSTSCWTRPCARSHSSWN